MDGIARKFRTQGMRRIRRWIAQRRDLQALISFHMQQGKAVIIDWGGTEERGRETKQPRGSCGVGSAKGAKNEVLTETEERNDSFQVKRGQDGHGLGRPKMLLLCCARKEGIDGKKMGGSEELKQPAMGKEEEEACSTELLGVILTGEAIEGERGGKFFENHTAVANRRKRRKSKCTSRMTGKKCGCGKEEKQGGLTGRQRRKDEEIKIKKSQKEIMK